MFLIVQEMGLKFDFWILFIHDIFKDIPCFLCRFLPCSPSRLRLSSSREWEGAWWRHQMETFSALQAICAGNSPVTGEFPAQRLVTRSFDVSLICAWINGWVNNCNADDLRRHRTHYVTVMHIYVKALTSVIFLGSFSNFERTLFGQRLN